MAGMAPPEQWEAAAQQLESLAIRDTNEQGAEGSEQTDGHASQGHTSAAAHDAGSSADNVDHALKDALAHPKNRASVLRLETEVEAFVLTSQEPQHVFSGDMSSYERLLAHRTAQHWGLETSTVNHGPEQGRIIAIRTPATKPPKAKLSDVSVTMVDSPLGVGGVGGSGNLPIGLPGGSSVGGGPPVGSPPAPRLLVRKRSDRQPHRGGGPGMMGGPGMEGPYGMPGANGQYRSVQEREQEYHRARARIFGEGAGGPGGYPPGAGPQPPPLRGGGPGGGMNGAGAAGMMGGMHSPFGGMMGPMGPQMGGAMGYAQNMGRPGAMPAAMYAGPGAAYGPGAAGPGAAYGPAAGGYGGGYAAPGGGYGGPSGPRPTKAQLRNKEADLADPDFRRGRGVHGQRFEPGFGEEAQAGSGAMYLRPTYGSEFPELPGGGSGEVRGGGRPAQSPRSNGGAGMMGGGMATSPIQGSPAAAMYASGYGGQMGGAGMSGQDMIPMQAYYSGQGMMPAGAMMAPMPGMMYQAGGGGMPYGMMAMGPYGYMPMRPGQQEAMMQAYATNMAQMGYAPYGNPAAVAAAGGMAMPMSPVAGMQHPMSPGGSMGRRSSSGRYAGGGGGRPNGSGQRSSGHTPRAADSMAHDRQSTPAVAAAAAAAAAQQAQAQAPPQPQRVHGEAQQQSQQQQQQGAPQPAAAGEASDPQ